MGVPLEAEERDNCGALFVFIDSKQPVMSENNYEWLLTDDLPYTVIVCGKSEAETFQVLHWNSALLSLIDNCSPNSDMVTDFLNDLSVRDITWQQVALKVYESGNPTSFDCFFLPANSWFRVTCFMSRNNLITGIADITSEKQQAREMLKAKVNADAASRAKGDFLANMSHEIRTPLNGVIGFSELLLNSKLSEVQRQYMENVNLSAKSLMELINNILDFSKIEAGKLEIFPDKTNLLSLVETVAEIVRFNALQKGIELLVRVAPDMPVNVMVDELRLRQVLINLISNAIKFTDRGEVELSVKLMLIKEKENEARFLFSVRDTGIGVSDADRKKLFTAFSQADSVSAGKYGGTGLGLVISNMLLGKMKSRIELLSTPGAGSNFFFEINLPLVNDNGQMPQKSLHIKNALVVDDNKESRKIFVDMLNYMGIAAKETEDGIEALKIIEDRSDFDLIVLDYKMPYINGLDVVRKMRAMTTGAKLRQPEVILYTSSEESQVFDECEQLNIRYRYIKPVKMSEFFQTLTVINESLNPQAIVADGVLESDAGNSFYSEEIIKVLVAEDDDVNMLLIGELIYRVMPNARLFKAHNGSRAVALFKEKEPNLVLMDVNMPIMNGLEATAEIRKLETATRVPIIALTAKVMDGSADECVAAGMDDYVPKPILFDNFVRVLARFFDSTKQPRKVLSAIESDKLKGHFDKECLLQKTGLKMATVNRMLDVAKASIPQYIARLEESLLQNDGQAFSDVAHTLKGTSGTLCFYKLELISSQMEELDFDKQKMELLLSALKDEWRYIESLI